MNPNNPQDNSNYNPASPASNPYGVPPASAQGSGQQPLQQQPLQQPLQGGYPSQMPQNRQTGPQPGQPYGQYNNPYNSPNPQPGYQAGGYSQPPLQPNPYSGYNASPYPGESVDPPNSGSGRGKRIGIVVGVIVLLGAIAAIAMVTGGGQDQSGDTSQTTLTDKSTANDPGADTVPRTDGQLDLSSAVDTSTSIKEQVVKAKLKEQVNLSSGFSFMVTKIDTYTSTDGAVKPGDGKKFVVVSAVVGNRAKANNLSVSYLDFKLRDKDNKLLDSHPATQQILNNTLANPTALKPGEQLTGEIVFEVGATDTDWVLIHKESYQKTTDNTTFDVQGEVVVSLIAASAPKPGDTTNSQQTPATPPAAST